MNHKQMKKMVLAAVFVAATVALSPLSIPIGGSKCFPVQHMMNVLGAVFLGPAYGVGAAFLTSLIRNLMGTGSFLAFPGSMTGALLCGMIYRYTKNLWATLVGEIVGTGVIGGLLAYPIAHLLIGVSGAAVMFVLPFLISTIGGSILAAIMLKSMEKMGVLDTLKKQLS